MDALRSRPRRLGFWWIVGIALLAICLAMLYRLGDVKLSLPKVEPGYYQVVEVNDGDTIQIYMNGAIETVRMIGVDTPETPHPSTPPQCYGPQASAFTKQLIGSKRVRLQADPLDTNRDRYGRLLRYVYLLDGTLIEERLIREGYGFAYLQFPFSKSLHFAAFETDAANAKLGLWSACRVIIEDNGRKQTNPL